MSHTDNSSNISSTAGEAQAAEPQAGSLSWRLSSHPMTLLCFLAFRTCTLRPPFPARSPVVVVAVASPAQPTRPDR